MAKLVFLSAATTLLLGLLFSSKQEGGDLFVDGRPKLRRLGMFSATRIGRVTIPGRTLRFEPRAMTE